MRELIRKKHNGSRPIYHIAYPAKYRRLVFTKDVDQVLREICLEIEKRYEIIFFEIGTDKNHVHFSVQSVPTYSPKRVVQMIEIVETVYRGFSGTVAPVDVNVCDSRNQSLLQRAGIRLIPPLHQPQPAGNGI